MTAGRRVGIARMVAACLAVFWGFLFYGLVDFLTPLVEGEEFAAHYLMETGWGLTFLVLVAVPLVVLAVRPGHAVAILQLGAVGVALAAGALLAGSPEHLLPAAGVLLTAAVLWLLSRPIIWLLGRPGAATAVVAAAAAVPAGRYAWQLARGTVNPEETWGLDHYPVQGAFAVAVLLVAVLAACTTRRGGRSCWLPTATAAFSAAWFGVLSVVWPARLGSLGTLGGWLAVAWAVALVTAVGVESRRANRPGVETGRGTATP